MSSRPFFNCANGLRFHFLEKDHAGRMQLAGNDSGFYQLGNDV